MLAFSLQVASFVASPRHPAVIRPNVHAPPPPVMIYPALSTALIAMGVALGNVKLVGTADTLLVERLGKYHRTLDPGLHVTLPLLERVSYGCTLREQVLDSEWTASSITHR